MQTTLILFPDSDEKGYIHQINDYISRIWGSADLR